MSFAATGRKFLRNRETHAPILCALAVHLPPLQSGVLTAHWMRKTLGLNLSKHIRIVYKCTTPDRKNSCTKGTSVRRWESSWRATATWCSSTRCPDRPAIQHRVSVRWIDLLVQVVLTTGPPRHCWRMDYSFKFYFFIFESIRFARLSWKAFLNSHSGLGSSHWMLKKKTQLLDCIRTGQRKTTTTTTKKENKKDRRMQRLQSTLSKADTLGTKATVRFREVSALERVPLQRYKCNSAGSGPNLLSGLESVRLERVDCNNSDMFFGGRYSSV